MNIYLDPQRNDEKIIYSFNGEIITVTYKGLTDIFDFSQLIDGEIKDISTVLTTLEIKPIISAERNNDALNVKLLNFLGANATHEEEYPQWIETS